MGPIDLWLDVREVKSGSAAFRVRSATSLFRPAATGGAAAAGVLAIDPAATDVTVAAQGSEVTAAAAAVLDNDVGSYSVNETFFVAGRDGFSIDPSSPMPQLSEFRQYLMAVPAGTPASEAIGSVEGSSYDPLRTVSFLPGTAFDSIATIENLEPGTSYDVFLVAHDPENLYSSATFRSITTTHDPEMDQTSVRFGVKRATIGARVRDVDSDAIFRVSVVSIFEDPVAAVDGLVSGAVAPDYSQVVPAGSGYAHPVFQVLGLAPGTAYRVVMVLIDAVTGEVVSDVGNSGSTYPMQTLALTPNAFRYDFIEASVRVAFYASQLDVAVTIARKDDPSVILDGYANRFANPNSYDVFRALSDLPTDTVFEIRAKASSVEEPDVVVDVTIDMKTKRPPSLSIGELQVSYKTVQADCEVVDVDVDSTVNVYLALVDGFLTDEFIEGRLLSLGSTAFPGTEVVPGQVSYFQTKLWEGLDPGGYYKVVLFAVDADDPEFTVSEVVPLRTFPAPVLSIDLKDFTDTDLLFDVVSSSEFQFNLYVSLVPNLIGNVPQYDPEEVSGFTSNDADTAVVLNTLSTDFEVAFSNLNHHRTYGVAVVAADPVSNDPITDIYAVEKTAALPHLQLEVDYMGYDQIKYRSLSLDEAGAHSVFTAILYEFLDGPAASNLVALGTLYPEAVPGSVSAYLNGAENSNISLSFCTGGLEPETPYVLAAAAIDIDTGIIQWEQVSFVTEQRPFAVIQIVEQGINYIDFRAEVDYGEDFNLYFAAYSFDPYLKGVTAEEVVTDSNSLTAVGLVPAGGSNFPVAVLDDVRVPNLAGGTDYYVVAVAESISKGFLSPIAVTLGSTEAAASISVSILSEETGRILTEATVSAQANTATNVPFYLVLVEGAVTSSQIDKVYLQQVRDGTAAGLVTRRFVQFVDEYNPVSAFPYAFDALEPATLYTLFALVYYQGSDEYVFQKYEVYTRPVPVVAVRDIDLTTGGFDAMLFVSVLEVVPGREVNLDVAVAIDGAASSDFSWVYDGYPSFVPLATEDVLLTVGESNVAAGVTEYSPKLLASDLDPFTTYQLVVIVHNNVAGEFHTDVTPVTTRAPVLLGVSLDTVTTSGADVAVSATLPDGTFTLFERYFIRPISVDALLVGSVPDTGSVRASGCNVVQEVYSIANLPPLTDFKVVYVARDDVSSELFHGCVEFTTQNLPPSIVITVPGVVVTASGITAPVVAKDADTGFRVYAGIVPITSEVDDAVLDSIVSDPGFSDSFSKAPGGAPFNIVLGGLTEDTQYRFLAISVDTEGQRAFDVHDFRTDLLANFLVEAEYDNQYTLTYRAEATYELRTTGAVVGNGKLALKSSLTELDMEGTYLAGAFDFNRFGGYTNNLVPSYNACAVSFFSKDGGTAFALHSQDVDMYTGIVTTRGTVFGDGVTLAVECDTMAVRQLPYCSLTQVRFSSGSNLDELRLYHGVKGSGAMLPPRFDCSLVHTNLDPVTVLTATARLRDSDFSIASASVYFPPDPSGAKTKHLGFNSFRNRDECFNGFSFSNVSAGREYQFSILTAHASGGDFPDPSSETKRMALTALGNAGASGAAKIRADHVAAWARTWSNSVILIGKPGILAQEYEEVKSIRRALRVAQYNVYSMLRDATVTEVNPLVLDSLDLDGNLFWNRELWLIPAMLYLKPRFVRTMLEYRFRSLQAARSLAGAQGYEGTKFEFDGDILGNEAAPYWDVAPGSYIFNTALVGVAAWDYFRATKDRDWLMQKGYAILSGVADYVVSTYEAGAFDAARTVNGESAKNPAFTIYSCKLAMKGAIEATYELNYARRTVWLDTFFALQLEFFPGADFEVVKEHSEHGLGDDSRVLEALLVMQGHYSARFFRELTRNTSSRFTLVANANHYETKPVGDYMVNPFNLMLVGDLYAQLSYHFKGYEGLVKSYTLASVEQAKIDIWGSVHTDKEAAFNDVSLSARQILHFVSGVCGLRISGGVSNTSYHYDQMGIRGQQLAYMPPEWEQVVVTDFERFTRRVWNRNPYQR